MLRKRAAVGFLCALVLGACAVNPATGRKQLSLYGERDEIAMDWTFRLVDDPAVNAFALPGGYVYVTK